MAFVESCKTKNSSMSPEFKGHCEVDLVKEFQV